MDNKAVANVANGDPRIDPRQMVAQTAGESPALLWSLRLTLGFFISFIALTWIGDFLGLWSFLPSTIIGFAVVWTADGRRLLQIGAEIADKAKQSAPSSPTADDTSLVLAVNVHPYDWTCSREKYTAILKDAERKDRRQRELSESRNTTPGQTEQDRPYSVQAKSEDPVIPLEWVIARSESPDGKRVVIRLASGDVLDMSRNQLCFRYRPENKLKNSPSIEEASQALSALLIGLAQGGNTESDLISSLERSYSSASVYRALRAALSFNFIEQSVGFGRIFREAGAIFFPYVNAGLRRKCVVSLSQAGNVWVQSACAANNYSESSRNSPENGKTSEPEPASNTTNNYIMHEPVFHTLISESAFNVPHGSRRTPGEKTPKDRSADTETRQAETHDDDDDDLNAYVVTWSAGVSAAGAALAALLVNGEAPWQRALFISLVFISSCTFGILIFAGLRKLPSRNRKEFRAQSSSDTPAANSDPAEHGTS